MTYNLWTPKELVADFHRRMTNMPEASRKKGIIVVLKTERCATKWFRGCSVTTAALEKRSTPLAADFAIYGVQLLPRDHDNPPGSLKIESGLDAWKNDAAGEYKFEQGPGATIVLLDPDDGSVIESTTAARLQLTEAAFTRQQGRTPMLESFLQRGLAALQARHRSA